MLRDFGRVGQVARRRFEQFEHLVAGVVRQPAVMRIGRAIGQRARHVKTRSLGIGRLRTQAGLEHDITVVQGTVLQSTFNPSEARTP